MEPAEDNVDNEPLNLVVNIENNAADDPMEPFEFVDVNQVANGDVDEDVDEVGEVAVPTYERKYLILLFLILFEIN